MSRTRENTDQFPLQAFTNCNCTDNSAMNICNITNPVYPEQQHSLPSCVPRSTAGYLLAILRNNTVCTWPADDPATLLQPSPISPPRVAHSRWQQKKQDTHIHSFSPNAVSKLRGMSGHWQQHRSLADQKNSQFIEATFTTAPAKATMSPTSANSIQFPLSHPI